MLKYSARVNYDVACPMHFEKYPVDIQRCNISFESWGHTNHYIVLSWLQEKRKFSSSIALAQFDLDLHFIEEPPSAFGALGKNIQWSITLLQFLKELDFWEKFISGKWIMFCNSLYVSNLQLLYSNSIDYGFFQVL